MAENLTSKTLVERMRQAADGICNGPCGEPYWWGEVMLLGATEIERLREELKSREIEHCGHGRPVGHCDTCEEDAERAAQPPNVGELGAYIALVVNQAQLLGRDGEAHLPKLIEYIKGLEAACGLSQTKTDRECGACDTSGAICSNQYGICSRHGGRRTGHPQWLSPNDGSAEKTVMRCTCRHDTTNGAAHADECPVERALCGLSPETSAAQPWRCSVCNTMNPDDANHCRQCEFSRTVMRDGKSVPRTGPY